MNKNIVIVHYNTPFMTECLVKSINKNVEGAKVYIFDNSDKAPFTAIFDNVNILDNTKGQLIDFESHLSKFPYRTQTRAWRNKCANAKHSMSIQKCIDMLKENFILLDSDVLLTRDISELYDDRYVSIFDIEEIGRRKRCVPFVTFINTVKMKELGLTYHDDYHMVGLTPNERVYDTGAWLYEELTSGDYPVEHITYGKYIVHYRGASWIDVARKCDGYKQVDADVWLDYHKKLWA